MYIAFKKIKLITALTASISFLPSAYALTYTFSPGQNIVGKVQRVAVGEDTDITDIAQTYDVGYYQLLEANQGTDINHLEAGDELTIPTQYILPNVPRKGIVIDLAPMLLFYYPPKTNEVMIFPVGIGRAGWNTPEGPTSIVEKKAHPVWHVPQSIQRDLALQGIQSPKSLPAGPGNPLGPYMMRLALGDYLVHGSNDPATVGRRSSSGCIHLYNNDIEILFKAVKLHTPVNIVNTPYKMTWQNNNLYFEAHAPIDIAVGTPIYDLQAAVKDLLDQNARYPQAQINLGKIVQLAEAEIGIPQIVGWVK
jgi:L,D-transpeptidase ErfK/SrfK